ncbi:MAG TPA: SDR family oxidoreductase [Methylomirabilota bacterium]|nr:SDR family oxidoreductase [Methylomirabilota bacterium]
MSLGGRTALVTGAGRGIGRAVVLALGKAGARLALTARTRSQLESVAGELAALGADAPVVQEMDVARPGSIEAGLAAIRGVLPRIDILVNNAGIAESAPIDRTDAALWDRHMAVNATAPFLLTRALLPGMLERRWGRIINMASLAGLGGAPYIAAYAASKHALVGLTRAAAAETAGTGVTVNAICPGYVATDMVWNGARRISEKTGKPFEEAVEAMARFNPSGKLIEPDQVAAAVLELCGEEARDRTGETVVIA